MKMLSQPLSYISRTDKKEIAKWMEVCAISAMNLIQILTNLSVLIINKQI